MQCLARAPPAAEANTINGAGRECRVADLLTHCLLSNFNDPVGRMAAHSHAPAVICTGLLINNL
jgi:hypothetical protein